jgi:hypothetical protein
MYQMGVGETIAVATLPSQIAHILDDGFGVKAEQP